MNAVLQRFGKGLDGTQGRDLEEGASMGDPNICVDRPFNDLDSQFLDFFTSASFLSAPI